MYFLNIFLVNYNYLSNEIDLIKLLLFKSVLIQSIL